MSKNTYRVASLNFLYKNQELERRLEVLTTEMQRIQPDVVCMQEISPQIEEKVLACMRELGFANNSGVAHIMDSKKGHGVVTFTKSNSSHSLVDLSLDGFLTESIPAVSSFVLLPDEEHYLLILNAHLTWGSRASGLRRRQLKTLVREADEAWEDQRLGAVLVGDMNSVPESSPIRFVKGLEDDGDGKGTLWVDAWEYLGAKPELEMTNIPAVNRLAAETCLPHGLDPQLVPARRIDYAFTHEYNYGGPGSPVDFGQWCDQPAEDGTWVSDHSGVWVDVKIS